MNNQASNVSAAKQSQVSEQVAVFEQTLEDAAGVWADLSARLAGVTRSETSACDRVGELAKETELVPLATKLRTLNRKLAAQVDHMRDTLKKLEL